MIITTKPARMEFLLLRGKYYTLDELAAMFGCSKQRAHQLCQDAGVVRLTLSEALRELRERGAA